MSRHGRAQQLAAHEILGEKEEKMRLFIKQQFEKFFIGAILNFEKSLDTDITLAKERVKEFEAYLRNARKFNHPDEKEYKKMLKQARVLANGKISLKNNFAEIKNKILLSVRATLADIPETEK